MKRSVVFRALAGFVACLFVFGGVLVAVKGEPEALLVMLPMAGLFGTYALYGEAQVQRVLGALGSKGKPEQKSGGRGEKGW